jgi:hypothetical protein
VPTYGTLKDVRELLSDPKRWTKGITARDAEGDPVLAYWQRPVCWCLLGACIKFNISPTAWSAIGDKLGPNITIAAFNDDAEHEQILSFLDELIKENPDL